MRIVFDTNVFIAAALRGGFAQDIISLADQKIVVLLTSPEILTELQKKLLTKFHWSKEQTTFFILKIKQIADVIEVTDTIIFNRDPDDTKILACAVSGKADLIVSLDQDLLALKEYAGIGIIHPKTLSYTFPKYFKQ
ncbi:MAG: putative toxin-antitoxin system toxin component, PIN family [Patescibacteria group bacterium]